MDGFLFDDKVTFVHFLNKLNRGMQSVELEDQE
jgi:hypothetical protein